MTRKDKPITASATNPDDVKPELDASWFEEADAYIGETLVRRGRPRSGNPKQPVSLRLDRDVVEWFKRRGDGWQTRINDELRRVAGL
jgi:uncharacterized protein (DUF4415 family)